MVIVLYTLLFLSSALSADGGTGIVDRGDYLRKIVPSTLPYVPPNDVEVWFAWRRIYMGEVVFADMALWNFSVKFQAPSDRLSTAIELDTWNYTICYKWVRINIPGKEVGRGQDIHYRLTPFVVWESFKVVLVFPQKEKLDVTTANQSLTALKSSKKCDLAAFENKFRLDRADAVNVYQVLITPCGGKDFQFPTDDKPDWDRLRQNMNQIVHPQLFSIPPRGVVEVDYLEGVSLRMGNCLPMFLTTSPPEKVKFDAEPGDYHTLCFTGHSGSPSCGWLLVNIPGGDFRKGDEVVPYSTWYPKWSDLRIFVLYSQGGKKVSISEAKNLSSLTPKAMSAKLKFDEPEAANFYRTYETPGVPPGKYPPRPPTPPIPPTPSTSSPSPRIHSSSPPRRPSTRGLTTRKVTGLATSAIPPAKGGCCVLTHGRVYVGVIALATLLQI